MAVREERGRMVLQMGSWDTGSDTFGGLHLLADTAVAVAVSCQEKKLLQVIGQGASGRSENYDYVGKMPSSNAVEKDIGTPDGRYMLQVIGQGASGRSENHDCVGKVPSTAEIVLLTTPFVPAWCKRKRSTLCSPMRGEASARSSSRCHEVSGSSMGEKAKKKEQVKREMPAKKPRREGPEPFEPRDMPQDLRYYIEATLGGTDIFPVSHKTLTATDVNPHHRRLFLPQADLGFLNEEEKVVLERPNVKDRAIPVKVLDPAKVLDPDPSERKPRSLTFTRWELKKNNDGGNVSTVYVLTKADWARLVGDNNLVVCDEIQIWSFRVGSRLHMAVVVAKRAPPKA